MASSSTLESASSTDDIKHMHILVPYDAFNLQPKNTIKSFIGVNSAITDFAPSDVILNDELLIVDVDAKMIELNPLKIYFIKKSDIKPIAPNSNKCGVRINRCNVIINMENVKQSSYKDYFPIKIRRCDNIEYKEYYSYFGSIVNQPMNSLITPLLAHGDWKLNPEPKLYPDGYKPKIKTPIDRIKSAYLNAFTAYPILGGITQTSLHTANSLSECTNELEGYLIDWHKLCSEKYIKGIILIKPIREPYLVCYIPTQMFTIHKEEIDSITSFLEYDEVNYLNFCYVTSQ